MPFHLTRDGVMTEIPAESRDQASVVTSLAEWERIGEVWPLKRLVAIWNALPGVTPVEKFTNRQIALERIWRAVESPEQAHEKAQGKGGQSKAASLLGLTNACVPAFTLVTIYLTYRM